MVRGAMRPSAVRYLALGVLAAGLAAIVWTATRGDGTGDEVSDASASAATTTVATTTVRGEETADALASAVTATVAATTVRGAETADASASAVTATVATTTVRGDETADASASAVTATVAATTVPAEPIEVMGQADTLTNLDGWLNTDATSLEEIRAANKLTVVQFWTFGCRNCKNTLEALGRLYADFRREGVEIVGVHSPEFSYEADVDNIIEASADLGVIWPIALDTDKRNFHRWQEGNIGYWPRVYVIDGDNQIRFDRTGDGRTTYAQLYQTVERLLAEA